MGPVRVGPLISCESEISVQRCKRGRDVTKLLLLKPFPNDLNHGFKQTRKKKQWIGGGPRQFRRLIGSSAQSLKQSGFGCFFKGGAEQLPLKLMQLRVCPVARTRRS